MNIQDQIFRLISKEKSGGVIFPEKYIKYGSISSINKALHLLVKTGQLIRLSHGIYLKPMMDPELGVLRPSLDQIAYAIARRDKVKITPSGITALQRLGISTQVPLKGVYLTTGGGRSVKVGKMTIVFKRTTSSKISIPEGVTKWVILAMDELGQKGMTSKLEEQLKQVLTSQSDKSIQNSARLAPQWIARFLYDYLNERNNDPLSPPTRRKKKTDPPTDSKHARPT